MKKSKNENQAPATTPLPIKAGVDKDGKPYIDMSDKNTARAFIEQAPRFKKIRIAS